MDGNIRHFSPSMIGRNGHMVLQRFLHRFAWRSDGPH
jgi:hypothetical protein